MKCEGLYLYTAKVTVGRSRPFKEAFPQSVPDTFEHCV